MKFSRSNQSPWLEKYFNQFLPNVGSLVELGVGHLVNGSYKIGDSIAEITCGSNSYDLIKQGWYALLIDPIQEYCEEAKSVYIDEVITGKVVIKCCGVSDKKEVLQFYMNDTFIPNNTPKLDLPYIGRLCNLETFETLVDSNFDLLSIDVEGFELKILRSIDFNRFTPTLIVVETAFVGTEEVSRILNPWYVLLQQDALNALYLRK